ncbi:MAG: methyltransferase domain-containing protein [Lachnospiraceae bacterium]|nr:methyltransferase domain-containing protein [Lachnospiraceae bacterium]
MNITWNAQNYQDNFCFVSQYGEGVMELLTIPEGSRVIDLGCGNGTLTEKLAERGYTVTGIDASKDMLALAQKEHPDLTFIQGDALSFTLEEKADAIFSNAVFHWIDEKNQEIMIANIADQLREGGELVCEFGGYGCAEAVHSTLEKCFAERGLLYPRTFYFPTVGEYTPLLEKHGLRVEFATLFDRLTPQNSEHGVIDWINMFVTKPFEGMDEKVKNDILQETENTLYERLFLDGKWYIDYVRIRIRARKMSTVEC